MFKLPDLPYPYDALEPYIDQETMRIHHDKHHATYINNLNEALADQPEFQVADVNALLADLSKLPESIRTKVQNNGGGHANHSFFWQIMGPAKKSHPNQQLATVIDSVYGSFDNFKTEFTQTGLARFGSGWVWLVVNGKNDLKIIDTANQDTPVSQGLKPILALDVWEHAYYLKYRNLRKDYIEAWWNVVNWDVIRL
ncbi:superoxide dismutase [Candidatus Roizmanbacteria bacterium RIFCSPLOWO2_02_FULL_38_10]|uniref:Superoxide dismutase n=1 Tax=Candidatus Roizmanbacteria bacterium RIFCSPLOWO2_02_FULL_38_10 TaxID=1802074 RepID=A0A1F7JK85_9BACT|nr:MAG: superoxide dismutase [Candidatus Roizmanbacteria bacterium RIFCSPLOWO2_02_FULL_38_10]